MRDVDRVGDGAGAEHRLGRAAGLGAVGLRVGPELQRHPDHLRPPLALEQRRDGAVDPAGHRDEDAALRAARRAARDEAAALARARCRASAASWAAWRLAGVSPPTAASTSSVPIRAASRTASPSTISATAAVAARVAPQPSASKRDGGDPPVVDGQRDAREIAAGRPAGGAGEGVGSGAQARSSRR